MNTNSPSSATNSAPGGTPPSGSTWEKKALVVLLVIVACTLLMGRDSATSMATTVAGRVRSWDVMFVAACPLVVASGLAWQPPRSLG